MHMKLDGPEFIMKLQSAHQNSEMCKLRTNQIDTRRKMRGVEGNG
jgi:hypothetical protein